MGKVPKQSSLGRRTFLTTSHNIPRRDWLCGEILRDLVLTLEIPGEVANLRESQSAVITPSPFIDAVIQAEGLFRINEEVSSPQ